MIYSQDLKNEEQLDNLLKKMTEGFKNPVKDREMRIQLFLLSRIIMLRLNSDWLAGALKKLWPHLLAELVSVFDVNESGGGRDYWLTIEGIKIVELMSQLNIEDFQMNQWMFLFDGYGIDYSGTNAFPQGSPGDAQSAQQQDLVLLNYDDSWPERMGVFQPYLVKFMCNKSMVGEDDDPTNGFVNYSGWQFNFYKVKRGELRAETDFSDIQTTEVREPALDREAKEYEKIDRKLDNTETNRMIEAEVYKYAYKLQDLLARANTRLNKLDRDTANALIERDFLKKPRNN